MPKFSIIVPVYNVEKYVNKCLDSIFNQTFKDFEVIVVNDGTQDNSMDIVKKYNVTIINQENKGLSEARNNGVKKAKGDYIIFVDSDDYIEKDLLMKINESTKNNPDLVRFQAKEINDKETKEYHEKPFYDLDGSEAFKLITQFHYVELACLYAIKRKYYIGSKYNFKKNTYHEDFGLIPLIIFNSDKVNSIDYCGYSYVKREGSIMNNTSYDKTKKKVEDTFNHYDFLIKQVDKSKKDTSFFKSFISNSLILKITELNSKDYKDYKKKLKINKVYDNLLDDTFSRKIKKIFVKKSPKLYYKIKGD